MTGRVELEQTWTLRLNTENLRLVLMALGSRLRAEHVDAAMELGDHLTRQRALATLAQNKTADRLLADVGPGEVETAPVEPLLTAREEVPAFIRGPTRGRDGRF